MLYGSHRSRSLHQHGSRPNFAIGMNTLTHHGRFFIVFCIFVFSLTYSVNHKRYPRLLFLGITFSRARHSQTFSQGSRSPIVTHSANPPIRPPSIRTMSTARDTTNQSDITKMKTEPDGSFKRLDASFRNIIQRGGKFEPERGMQLII